MDNAFQLTMPEWEIVIRASVVYLAIVALVRVVPKRSAGSISPNDMLALVLVGALAADGQISVVKARDSQISDTRPHRDQLKEHDPVGSARE